jgi:serine/threonine protein kinase
LKLMPLEDLPGMYDMSEEEYLAMIETNYRNEVEALKALAHPSIPRLYDHGEFEGGVYVAMKYIEGRTMLAVMLGRPEGLQAVRAVEWGAQVCDALTHMHERETPVIFRDVKPSNMMLDKEGRVFLIDFGLADREGEGLDLVGTIGFAPPEQYEGRSDARTDVYALGATLHYLLTRRDPHHHEPFSFDEAPPRALNPEVPQALEDAIMKAVEYEPRNRFQSAREMKKALKKIKFKRKVD